MKKKNYITPLIVVTESHLSNIIATSGSSDTDIPQKGEADEYDAKQRPGRFFDDEGLE